VPTKLKTAMILERSPNLDLCNVPMLAPESDEAALREFFGKVAHKDGIDIVSWIFLSTSRAGSSAAWRAVVNGREAHDQHSLSGLVLK